MGWWLTFPCSAHGTRVSTVHGLLWLSHAESYEPGIVSVRYEELAGASAQRVEWFRALLHFGKTVDEWEALPWWQPQMYMEELSRYLRMKAGEETPQDTPVDGDIADLSDLGVKLETVN